MLAALGLFEILAVLAVFLVGGGALTLVVAAAIKTPRK
jgi:hypothetical protein